MSQSISGADPHSGPRSSGPRRFGPNTVEILVDGVFDAPGEALLPSDNEAAGRRSRADLGPEALRIDVNAFLLRGPEGVTLVDTGAGLEWGVEFGRLRRRLRERGIAPEAVDRVLLTHLHGDHALGLLNGEAAYFPRAAVLVPEADWRFFNDASERARAAEQRRAAFDIAARVGRAYSGRLRTLAAGPVFPGIALLPLPGHTPGHSGYLLEGPREESREASDQEPDGEPEGALLIWGDAVHFAGPQAADPGLGVIYDVDPAQAGRTRRSILERAAAEGWAVAGGHVRGFGAVVADGRGFRIG